MDERNRTDGPAVKRLRVAVSGATGFVGSALTAHLAGEGHKVRRIVRRDSPELESDILWRPDRREIDGAALEGLDAVIHLAGANLAARRWSGARKAVLQSSRVDTTRFLAETLAACRERPDVFLSTSAIGYYGSRGDEELTEESAAGSGFLADLCRAWEEAADPARDAGIRVVHPRIGLVLGPGGALGRMLPFFRLGIAGRFGNGDQWMSWIARTDLVRLLAFLIRETSISGAVNAVAASPVTNRDFTKILGRIVGRPTFLAVPAAAVSLLFGEMGRETLLASTRVHPVRAETARFPFRHPDLEGAIRAELIRSSG